MKIVNLQSGDELSSAEFLASINTASEVSNVVQFTTFTKFYADLLNSIFHFEEVHIFDKGDVIPEQVTSLKVNSSNFQSLENLQTALKEHSNTTFVLATSGTTGQPKKVKQTLQNLLRPIKYKESFRDVNWLFCYSPSHIAGLQVFLQCLFNRSNIFYAFEAQTAKVGASIVDDSINYISCTPTFFNNFSPFITGTPESVMGITFGGERLSGHVKDIAHKKFPNAKIRNLYASTEFGTILSANEKGFSIPASLKSVVKIEENELLVHKSLVAQLEVEFIDDWYHTGDLVEFLSDNYFQFSNRKSQSINVGGYNVNPKEIEDIICRLGFIKAANVYGRKNSVVGNIIIADVILDSSSSLTEAEVSNNIISSCKQALSEWKIPRRVNIVTEFHLTKTGKVKTNV